jgi:hypothetical protein
MFEWETVVLAFEARSCSKSAKKRKFHFPPQQDVFICVENGDLYESEGIRFADIETAARFSREFTLPETSRVTPFGFHKHRGKNHSYPRFPSKITMAGRTVKSLLVNGLAVQE